MTDALLTETTAERTTAETATEASVRVIEAVADATDADPATMPPLFEAIDPDALNALVNSMTEGHLAFEVGDCDVTVHCDATVAVEEVR